MKHDNKGLTTTAQKTRFRLFSSKLEVAKIVGGEPESVELSEGDIRILEALILDPLANGDHPPSAPFIVPAEVVNKTYYRARRMPTDQKKINDSMRHILLRLRDAGMPVRYVQRTLGGSRWEFNFDPKTMSVDVYDFFHRMSRDRLGNTVSKPLLSESNSMHAVKVRERIYQLLWSEATLTKLKRTPDRGKAIIESFKTMRPRTRITVRQGLQELKSIRGMTTADAAPTLARWLDEMGESIGRHHYRDELLRVTRDSEQLNKTPVLRLHLARLLRLERDFQGAAQLLGSDLEQALRTEELPGLWMERGLLNDHSEHYLEAVGDFRHLLTMHLTDEQYLSGHRALLASNLNLLEGYIGKVPDEQTAAVWDEVAHTAHGLSRLILRAIRAQDFAASTVRALNELCRCFLVNRFYSRRVTTGVSGKTPLWDISEILSIPVSFEELTDLAWAAQDFSLRYDHFEPRAEFFAACQNNIGCCLHEIAGLKPQLDLETEETIDRGLCLLRESVTSFRSNKLYFNAATSILNEANLLALAGSSPGVIEEAIEDYRQQLVGAGRPQFLRDGLDISLRCFEDVVRVAPTSISRGALEAWKAVESRVLARYALS